MPTLIIDNLPIEVPVGTKVIDAAEMLGIMIPRFCYHPALGSVGACRACAVMFLEGPGRGIQMSCMVEALDEMVVSTHHPDAVQFRQYVMEWLMLHHPHDCPVCDEGGHCLLQDMTVSGGHGIRRYRGKKRTHRDQHLGPLVQHEMNRCIQCYRCSRFYQEFAGYKDLGVMGSANRVYFGRSRSGTLESPFAGNLSDLCPTGVYTDKPSRYKGRRWDYERSPSVCTHCSLGCHLTVSARYREVVRQEARFSAIVNGHFICDRGRHGFYYTSAPERPRQAKVDHQLQPWEQAVKEGRKRLAQVADAHGKDAVACVGSCRNSLETVTLLDSICRHKGWQGPVFWEETQAAQTTRTVVKRLEPPLAVSMQEIEDADFILGIGADPLNESPMLALALRQAQRRGARVVMIDPRPLQLPFEFEQLYAHGHGLTALLAWILKASIPRQAAESIDPQACRFYDALPSEGIELPLPPETIQPVVSYIKKCQQLVLVCGTVICDQQLPALAADGALLLQAYQKQAGLFYTLGGGNAFGAAMLSRFPHALDDLLPDIENGRIKALVCVEADPFGQHPNGERIQKALAQLDLLISVDHVNTSTTHAADIFLPTTSLYENGGIFVNQEGRAQQALPAIQGDRPIAQVSRGNHPPREFGLDLTRDDVRPTSDLLGKLADDTAPSVMLQEAKEIYPLVGELLSSKTISPEGVRLLGTAAASRRFETPAEGYFQNGPQSSEELTLILADRTFGSEPLSSLSPALQQLDDGPCLQMHTRDAEDLRLAPGSFIVIEGKQGQIKVPLAVSDKMAAGVAVLYRHHTLKWQQFESSQMRLPKSCIHQAEKGV
jgi:NADH-quinone oxidoreductase subunit G